MEVIDLTSDSERTRRPPVRRPRPLPDDPELVLVSEKLKHAPAPCEPPSSRQASTPPPSKRPRLKTTEAFQVVGLKKGIKPLEDYPHARFSCTQHAFSTTNALKYCSKCFCFVCDILASACQEWHHHCYAVDNEEWKMKRRERRKASRRYERGVDLLAKEARMREKRCRKEKERREVLEALGETLTFEQLMAEQMEAVSEFYKGMVADAEQTSPQQNEQNAQSQAQAQSQPHTPLPTLQDTAQRARDRQLNINSLILPTLQNASIATAPTSLTPSTNPVSSTPQTTSQAQPCYPTPNASNSVLPNNDTNGTELAHLGNVFLSLSDKHPTGFAHGETTGKGHLPGNETQDRTRRILDIDPNIYAGLERMLSRHTEASPSTMVHARISPAAKRAKRKEKRSKHRQRIRSRSRMRKSDEQ